MIAFNQAPTEESKREKIKSAIITNDERFERLVDLFVTLDKSFDQMCDEGKAWWDLKSNKKTPTTVSNHPIVITGQQETPVINAMWRFYVEVLCGYGPSVPPKWP
jgi:hypothetical protein